MLRQLPQEDRKEPAVDHDLRADFLRTVEARPIVDEAEDPQADPFFDVDGVERLRGPGRRSGWSSPTGGTFAGPRIRLGTGAGCWNLPERRVRGDLVPCAQGAEREPLRGR